MVLQFEKREVLRTKEVLETAGKPRSKDYEQR